MEFAKVILHTHGDPRAINRFFFHFTGPDCLTSWVMSVPSEEQFGYGHASREDIQGVEIYIQSWSRPRFHVEHVINLCLSEGEVDTLRTNPDTMSELIGMSP